MNSEMKQAEPSAINSKDYWDERFATDWEANFGREQSRFFSDIALEKMPDWFVRLAAEKRWSICDWGCAQGDGTKVLADFFRNSEVIGVDFAAEGIEKATEAYGNDCQFISDDFLRQETSLKYDVLFSSNTLEHFKEPWEVIKKLAERANDFMVFLLPFEEYERISEHFVTFDFASFPLAFDDWFAVHSATLDVSKREPSYWHGKQILVIYGRGESIKRCNLSLSDVTIQTPSQVSQVDQYFLVGECSTTADKEQEIRTELASILLERDVLLKERDSALQTSALLVAEKNTALVERDSALVEKDNAVAMVSTMRQSKSWRLTSPVRFGVRLMRYGLVDADRRRVREAIGMLYRRLPLPLPVKHGLRRVFKHVVEEPLKVISRKSVAENPFIPPLLSPAQKKEGMADYFIWGVIDWHFRHQRPQQLSQAIAKGGRRVFYISVVFIDDERGGFAAEPLDASGRLFSIRLFVRGTPVIYTTVPNTQIVERLSRSIGEVLAWADSCKTISIVQHPFWHEVATRLPNGRLVYDCMDHHDGFENTANEMSALENCLFSDADLTITTSDWLDRYAAQYTDRRTIIRNAADFNHFSKPPANIYRDEQGRRIIGYYGAIAEWFDQDLVEAVARRFPDCCILLVGADSVDAKRKLGQLPNVRFTGEVSYGELPSYLYGFDVCMLPFKVIPLTLATNPVKVYEYLSAGKPVVSVDLPEISQCQGLVRVGANAGDFLDQLAAELATQPSTEADARRRAFAAGQTWGHRVNQLISDVESGKDDPLVSVIVVTYNNLNLTQACLASIDKHSDYDCLEIIVVDNASSDGSPDFLVEWAKGAPNRKLILNADNRGFAAGNNQGLAAASGTYMVLLNNDTHVTPGWVRTMVRHLQRNPNIGLIGPVTNNIGNEAKIEIDYDDMQQMLEKSACYTRHHLGKTFRLHTAAFFCVMMPRSTYEHVGPLDEAFGRGYFEDDDYCRRVEELGKEIVCAEDVFIHHHLSASFNKLKSKERQALFDQNRVLYEAKWGKWTPHAYVRKDSAQMNLGKKKSSFSVDVFKQKPLKEFPGLECIEGSCVVCGRDTKFYFADKALWRESLTCGVCLTTSRYRSVARGVLDAVSELTGVKKSALSQLAGTTSVKELSIYDTQPPFYYEPCSYPLPDLLKAAGWIDVSLSQFRPYLPPGASLSEGVSNQNLECLTYDDESFDIVITSDVMEHVRLDDRAHREIFRILRPGGVYIFTVPHDWNWEKTLTRVQIVDADNPSRDLHLLEPEYHGDTNNEKGEGVLAYRTYGRDLAVSLSELGFVVEYTKEDLPQLGILNTELFYCRKPA